mmetsp:Transcript_9102/g.8698  ORF Transcript_9102/g.8698 Transcript_9102/m.8698 type:complete len:101 (+) Transcript_9102:848-1150(+)
MEEKKKTLNNNNKGKNNNNNEKQNKSSIVTEWKCHTCNKLLSTRPKLCIAYKHKVVIKRSIKKKLTSVESRLKQKDVENGGIVLGAGLEWSGGWKAQSIS